MTQTKSKQIMDLMCTTVTRAVFVAMCLTFLSVGLAAQENLVNSTPSEVTTGGSDSDSTTKAKQKKEDGSNFNVKSSFELGVRGRILKGDENKYRSDLNYGSGLRLFDSSVLVTAKDSDGEPFDTLMVTGSGWNADPNGIARISMEKMGIYRFDSSIRRFSYFNSLSNFALNEHTRNTKRGIGDFDVTLFPQNDFQVRLGYSYNTQSGPGGITYDFDRDEFPILANFDSRANDFRFGFDAKVLGFNLSFTEGYRRFEDETDYRIDVPQLGANPNPRSSFDTFSRLIPEIGTVNYHSLSVQRSFEKKFDFSGRLIYSDSKSRFTMLEKLTGIDRFGNIVVLDQGESSGESKRPNLVGDIGLTFFVTDKFTISNTFSANSYRITGGNQLLETSIRTTSGGAPLPTTMLNELVYRFTDFQRYIDTIEASFDVNRYFSFYGGYRYTKREVTLAHIDTDVLGASSSFGGESAENTTNTLLAGFKLSPVPKKWTLFFDVEHGEADNSFTRLGNYDSTNIRIRNRFKPVDQLSINLSFQTKDNTNPGSSATISPGAFVSDIKSRNASASFDWNPNEKASLSGGFTHYRVTSETPVVFPVTGTSRGEGFSRYKLRSNYGHIDAWLRPHNRLAFFGSYRITRDTGQGDFFSPTAFTIDGNYPISFQSPEMRATMKLSRWVDFNLGYQYYKFEEKIMGTQNYSAHLPYGSLRIYFGGDDR